MSQKLFIKDDIKMASRYLKSCSTTLVRDMKVKNTMRHHHTPTEMAKI